MWIADLGGFIHNSINRRGVFYSCDMHQLTWLQFISATRKRASDSKKQHAFSLLWLSSLSSSSSTLYLEKISHSNSLQIIRRSIYNIHSTFLFSSSLSSSTFHTPEAITNLKTHFKYRQFMHKQIRTIMAPQPLDAFT